MNRQHMIALIPRKCFNKPWSYSYVGPDRYQETIGVLDLKMNDDKLMLLKILTGEIRSMTPITLGKIVRTVLELYTVFQQRNPV